MEDELPKLSRDLEATHSKEPEAKEALHAELQKVTEKAQEVIAGYKECFDFKLGLERSRQVSYEYMY
ncbi:hypothetical protein BHE74_00056576 [Ensete ventricosum]|nr:hypothetical protein BHE74_00056576 [Ensete ventricosum]